jgi:hypothetical protein
MLLSSGCLSYLYLSTLLPSNSLSYFYLLTHLSFGCLPYFYLIYPFVFLLVLSVNASLLWLALL